MTCQNCSRTLSCGCKKRTATDGKQVCTLCIEEYEKKLKSKKEKEDNPQT